MNPVMHEIFAGFVNIDFSRSTGDRSIARIGLILAAFLLQMFWSSP